MTPLPFVNVVYGPCFSYEKDIANGDVGNHLKRFISHCVRNAKTSSADGEVVRFDSKSFVQDLHDKTVADPVILQQWKEACESGMSNGNALHWTYIQLSPHANFKKWHAHVGMEIDYIFHGSLLETHLPTDEGIELKGDQLLLESVDIDMELNTAKLATDRHIAGSMLVKRMGSIHRTFSGEDGSYLICITSKWAGVNFAKPKLALHPLPDRVETAQPMNAAMAMVRALTMCNIHLAFLYPGAKNIPLMHAIHSNPFHFRGFLNRTEQACGFASEGFNKSSMVDKGAGILSCVVTTSGPGALNLASAIGSAYADSIPLIAIAGQVPDYSLGTHAFQEMPICDIYKPICKTTLVVKNPDDAFKCVFEAYRLARSGRPGPVVIDFPENIQPLPVSDSSFSWNFPHDDLVPESLPLGVQLEKVPHLFELLSSALNPLVLLGGGARHVDLAKLMRMSESCQVPIVYSMMGKGIFPDGHRHNLGMIGVHGIKSANQALVECCLLLSIGSRFDERSLHKSLSALLQNSNPVIMHVNIDAAEINSHVKADHPVVCDGDCFLEQLCRCQSASAGISTQLARARGKWIADLHQVRISDLDMFTSLGHCGGEEQPQETQPDELLTTKYVIKGVDKFMREHKLDYNVCCDVGQNQVVASQYLTQLSSPSRWLTQGGLACMGNAVPAAIGVHLANPLVPSLVIAGDGATLMSISELSTIGEHLFPIKMLIFVNGVLGMVEQAEEETFKTSHVFTQLGSNDFAKIANAFNIKSETVATKAQFGRALGAFFEGKGPFLLQLIIPELGSKVHYWNEDKGK